MVLNRVVKVAAQGLFTFVKAGAKVKLGDVMDNHNPMKTWSVRFGTLVVASCHLDETRLLKMCVYFGAQLCEERSNLLDDIKVHCRHKDLLLIFS